MKLPEKLKNLTPYIPDTNKYEVRLDANESFITPPDWMEEKLARALTEVRFNRYPDPMARELCRAAAELYGVQPECCVAGNGSDELIYMIMSAFMPRGGRIVVAEPDFSMYRFYSGLCEVNCLAIDRENGFPHIERMLEAANDADMLIFSNPCNPTGRGMRADDLRRLLDGTDRLVVVDEAYMDFWDQSMVRDVEKRHNLIVLRTCSKAFGMAGIRLGFALARERTASLLKTVKSPYNVSALTQAAGLAVLGEREYLEWCAKQIAISKDNLRDRLSQLLENHEDFDVIDTVTNFVLVRLPRAAEVHRALQAAGISVRCINGMLRVSAGSEAENKRFIDALEEVLSK